MAVKERENKMKRKGMLHKNACWYNGVCSILLSYKENGMKVIIIGGVAGGAGTTASFRRFFTQLQNRVF
ncbi:hypothetical protein KQI42_10175 [Tissierella sp. MSJ-40]|uniref:Uncharacterized protein n=1 Tax=Tissierella simiarum TaxID=2841534 RepID=A0ABS6E641_9FIRM|nr:hypothetical protein [Tissierella simiarum]MBU5438377.1 hypothetical protein [Tissierella simiarum]